MAALVGSALEMATDIVTLQHFYRAVL